MKAESSDIKVPEKKEEILLKPEKKSTNNDEKENEKKKKENFVIKQIDAEVYEAVKDFLNSSVKKNEKVPKGTNAIKKQSVWSKDRSKSAHSD